MRSLSSLVSLALLACFAAACSSSTDGKTTTTDTGGDPDVAPSFCDSDPRAQTFTPGLLQKGKSSLLEAKLLTIDPSRPSKGDNAWTIQLLTVDGEKPIDGATLTIKPFMPDHGHGSAIVPLVTPTGSDGKYAITRLNLFMPGLWQITINAEAPGATPTTDAIVYSFCVRE
jgi:hypothetical protein